MFALYLDEGKIEPEVVENMRSWQYSGFSARQSVLLSAGDQAGIERLVQYMVRCPFSLSRLVEVTDSGQVVYKAEKQQCQAFPDQKGDGTQAGPNRNFQILSPLDFLAEFSQHDGRIGQQHAERIELLLPRAGELIEQGVGLRFRERKTLQEAQHLAGFVE